MKIRLFRPEDLEQLTRFWKELQSNSIVAGNFCIPTEENVARWQRYVITIHEADKNQILVAEMKRKLVGYVIFLKQEGFPLETKYAWAAINEIYVHPDYRRKGVATELMKKAFDYLKSLDVTYVRLNVMINNHAAIKLYRKLGFEDHSLKMQTRLTSNTN